MGTRFIGRYLGDTEVEDGGDGYLYVSTGSGYSGRAVVVPDILGIAVVDALRDGRAATAGIQSARIYDPEYDLDFSRAHKIAATHPGLLWAASHDAIAEQASRIARDPSAQTDPGYFDPDGSGEWIYGYEPEED